MCVYRNLGGLLTSCEAFLVDRLRLVVGFFALALKISNIVLIQNEKVL